MSLRINDTAPNFTAKTTQGAIDFHEWIGDSGRSCSRTRRISRRCARPSSATWRRSSPSSRSATRSSSASRVDPVDSHAKWAKDIEETQGAAVEVPDDRRPELAVAKLYNMLPADEPGTSEGRTAATNATVRSVFVIGPDKKIKLMLTYPMTTGPQLRRDPARARLDAADGQAQGGHAGELEAGRRRDHRAGSVSDEDAKKLYPDGWKAPKPYLRIDQAARLTRAPTLRATRRRPNAAA